MLLQRLGDAEHHRFGTTDKGGIDALDINPAFEKLGAFLFRHEPREELDILCVLLKDMDHIEAAHVDVLEIFQFLAEHDRADALIGIDQRKLGLWLGLKCGFDQRQNGRDP